MLGRGGCVVLILVCLWSAHTSTATSVGGTNTNTRNGITAAEWLVRWAEHRFQKVLDNNFQYHDFSVHSVNVGSALSRQAVSRSPSSSLYAVSTFSGLMHDTGYPLAAVLNGYFEPASEFGDILAGYQSDRPKFSTDHEELSACNMLEGLLALSTEVDMGLLPIQDSEVFLNSDAIFAAIVGIMGTKLTFKPPHEAHAFHLDYAKTFITRSYPRKPKDFEVPSQAAYRGCTALFHLEQRFPGLIDDLLRAIDHPWSKLTTGVYESLVGGDFNYYLEPNAVCYMENLLHEFMINSGLVKNQGDAYSNAMREYISALEHHNHRHHSDSASAKSQSPSLNRAIWSLVKQWWRGQGFINVVLNAPEHKRILAKYEHIASAAQTLTDLQSVNSTVQAYDLQHNEDPADAIRDIFAAHCDLASPAWIPSDRESGHKLAYAPRLWRMKLKSK